MSENKLTILAVILLIIVGVLMNSCNNSMKANICERDGGTFVENVSDANQSTCIMKGK